MKRLWRVIVGVATWDEEMVRLVGPWEEGVAILVVVVLGAVFGVLAELLALWAGWYPGATGWPAR